MSETREKGFTDFIEILEGISAQNAGNAEKEKTAILQSAVSEIKTLYEGAEKGLQSTETALKLAAEIFIYTLRQCQTFGLFLNGKE